MKSPDVEAMLALAEQQSKTTIHSMMTLLFYLEGRDLIDIELLEGAEQKARKFVEDHWIDRSESYVFNTARLIEQLKPGTMAEKLFEELLQETLRAVQKSM